MRAPRHTKADLTAVPASPAEKPTGRASTRSKRTPELEVVFGVRIRAARIAARMSQGDLGAALGVSFQQVQKYENGKDRIAASTMQRIAAALGVHAGSFFGDDMPAPSGSIPDVKAAMRIANRIQRVRSPDVIKRLMALVDLLAEEAEAGPSVDDGTESP